jgi:hypothetical protein
MGEIPIPQLIECFNDELFVLKTQQQIEKDFAKFNLNFPEEFISTPFSKVQIEGLIMERVSDLMRGGESRLLQLLYTIDVSEKEFLKSTTQPEFLTQLAENILRREAYKVFLRMHFK